MNPILKPNIEPNIDANIGPILNPILNPILKAKKNYHALYLHLHFLGGASKRRGGVKEFDGKVAIFVLT